MSGLLSLSRAARLVGVSRGALQRKVRDGVLDSFEGMVRVSDLLRAFPGTQLEDEAEHARVSGIKERAFGRRVLERLLPDKEVLAARLGELGQDLAESRVREARSQELLRELARRLADEPLGAWLRREMEVGMASSDEERAILAREGVMRVIAPHVKVVPGGQEFFVEGADSLLEAALRVGLAMPYGCSSGNCGDCKARVVAGRVARTRPHDYRLTEAEKLQGYALMCCNTAVTDLVIEAAVARGASDIARQSVTTHVLKMEPLSPEVMLLELVTPRTNRLRFLAGQSAEIVLGGMRATLPIASCPCEERRLHFHLRQIPGNRVSDYAFGRLKLGESVPVEGPLGDFVPQDESGRPIVFIAFGWMGFAPVKSIIEHALAQEAAESIDLWWIGANPSDHYHPKLCRAWAEALDNFHYHPLIAGAGLHGQVTESVRHALEKVAPELGDLAERDVYVAGEPAQVDATRAFLLASGLPSAQLRCWESQ